MNFSCLKRFFRSFLSPPVQKMQLFTVMQDKKFSYFVFNVIYYFITSFASDLFCVFFIESVCPTRIPVASRDEKGFDILLGLDIKKKVKKRIQIPSTNVKAYEITSRIDLTGLTRYFFLLS